MHCIFYAFSCCLIIINYIKEIDFKFTIAHLYLSNIDSDNVIGNELHVYVQACMLGKTPCYILIYRPT